MDKAVGYASSTIHRIWRAFGLQPHRSETFKLRRLYNADNVDSKVIVEQQRKVDDLRRQMLTARLDMRKQVESVLTPEQRKQVRQYGPWWAREDGED